MSTQRHKGSRPGAGRRIGLTLFGCLTLFFLMAPVLIVVIMSFSDERSLAFPPTSWSLRWYEVLFGDPRWRKALENSLLIGLVSSLVAVFVGGLVSYAVARGRFRAVKLLEANFIAPLITPSVVIGVALYLFYAKIGLLGTFPGLVIAHAILGVPYVLLVMMTAFRMFDHRIEQAAMSLGASWPYLAWRVIVPAVAPSLLVAWLFAFVTSFDEVIITLFISGGYDTIPKRMFNELLLEVNPTITAVATIMILASCLILGAVVYLISKAKLPQDRLIG
ncbi:ABC transporter permease [Mesorhizobium sp. A623]